MELLEHRALEDGALGGELERGTEALDEAGRLLDEDGTRGAADLVHVPRVVEVAVGDLEGRELGVEIERQVRNATEILLHIRRDGGGGEEGGHLAAVVWGVAVVRKFVGGKRTNARLSR
eukprot:scaffold9383_cov58-Phaeocystis_antarctica.AAC.2